VIQGSNTVSGGENRYAEVNITITSETIKENIKISAKESIEEA
jgi:hypothetical protein